MPNQKTQKRTSDALELMSRLTGDSPEMLELLEPERANLDIARKIYALRTKAKLSQVELAKKVGTTQSVISRLEDADYDGHSLAASFNMPKHQSGVKNRISRASLTIRE
jgi:ribosome-binding protein aMBF1 (putative translation factor)